MPAKAVHTVSTAACIAPRYSLGRGATLGEAPMKSLLFSLLAAMGLALVASTVSAEDYPLRPIRIVVPFAAGGSVDIISRMLGDKMTMAWGQPVIVDGKPGAGGIIAANAVAKSPGDGYT